MFSWKPSKKFFHHHEILNFNGESSSLFDFLGYLIKSRTKKTSCEINPTNNFSLENRLQPELPLQLQALCSVWYLKLNLTGKQLQTLKRNSSLCLVNEHEKDSAARLEVSIKVKQTSTCAVSCNQCSSLITILNDDCEC